jgi:SNF2-related domain
MGRTPPPHSSHRSGVLRKQWSQELSDKFSLPSTIIEAKVYNDARKRGVVNPFDHDGSVVITSYEFVATKADDVARGRWDLVIFDEAHRLRNVYKQDGSVRAKKIRDATRAFFKVLLTATPLQNSLLELYGLVSVLDEHFFGSEAVFRSTYLGGANGRNALLFLRKRLEPICKRTLRRQVQQAGLIRYTERCPLTLEYEPSQDEMHLYRDVSAYLQRADTIAFGERPNALVTLIVRKILGSSTFALSETLTKILDRLKAKQRPSIESLVDYDVAEEVAEEMGECANGESQQEPPIDPTKLTYEIAELESYRELALRIGENAKGLILEVKARNELDDPIVQARPPPQRNGARQPTSMPRRQRRNRGSMLFCRMTRSTARQHLTGCWQGFRDEMSAKVPKGRRQPSIRGVHFVFRLRNAFSRFPIWKLEDVLFS